MPTYTSREEGQQPKLLEATLVGLQAIKGKYGPGSTQAQAAQKMLDGVLAQIWQVRPQYATLLPQCTSRDIHGFHHRLGQSIGFTSNASVPPVWLVMRCVTSVCSR